MYFMKSDNNTKKHNVKYSQKEVQGIIGNKRLPYIFQIGLDFGTSYSKCVFRDIYKERSFVFTLNNKRKEFLISSAIIYKNNRFYMNHQNYQYPEHGLWHIKMALADIAREKYNSPDLENFSRAANLKSGSSELNDFVKACGLFYLSRILYKIRNNILTQYSDYKANAGDDMYVTMAIPVSNIEDKNTENIFLELLQKAWVTVCQNKSLSEESSYQEVIDILKSPIPFTENCHVYPEVSANIQAFQNIPWAEGGKIYLVTDIGAGTVDQCSFRCTKSEQLILHYLSAQIFGLGSSLIERKCACSFHGNEDEWRQCKEEGKINDNMKLILRDIRNILMNKVSSCTLNNMKQKLSNCADSAEDMIQNKLYLIFSGGGDMDNPYRRGVIDSLTDVIGSPREGWGARIISIQPKTDIELYGHNDWMKRLYVAYGLSHDIYENLLNQKFPDEMKDIAPKIVKSNVDPLWFQNR